ncbi:uncharacterized protein LOC120773524 [Bactrocera tryoni]|uniref:uncharacterized protein LOC120773524 n=1 Tax=Bactrocera tryoni TaxID=59916 RepID=UPI001A97E584|nr:uncharacterized protein LOC120773524 [Bactrocera tryoni]
MYWQLKTLLFLTALLCLGGVEQVAAWMAFGNYHNPAHAGKCTISETIVIAPGEKVKSPETCAEIHCGNEKGDATITGCVSIGAPDGCEWGDYVNEKADFPACCAQYLNCVGGLNNETQSYQENIWAMFSPDLKISGLEGAAEAKGQ